MTPRHVYVRAKHAPVELPGLLVDWRRASDGEWEGLVVYIEEKLGRTVTEWVPVDRLRPVEGTPRST